MGGRSRRERTRERARQSAADRRRATPSGRHCRRAREHQARADRVDHGDGSRRRHASLIRHSDRVVERVAAYDGGRTAVSLVHDEIAEYPRLRRGDGQDLVGCLA